MELESDCFSLASEISDSVVGMKVKELGGMVDGSVRIVKK